MKKKPLNSPSKKLLESAESREPSQVRCYLSGPKISPEDVDLLSRLMGGGFSAYTPERLLSMAPAILFICGGDQSGEGRRTNNSCSYNGPEK